MTLHTNFLRILFDALTRSIISMSLRIKCTLSSLAKGINKVMRSKLSGGYNKDASKISSFDCVEILNKRITVNELGIKVEIFDKDGILWLLTSCPPSIIDENQFNEYLKEVSHASAEDLYNIAVKATLLDLNKQGQQIITH